MNTVVLPTRFAVPSALCRVVLVLVLGAAVWVCDAAAGDQLQRLPSTAANGALHYQRAILLLGNVDLKKREPLTKPIWKIIGPDTSEDEIRRIDELLIASRHAIRSAITGASQPYADFGADLQSYSAATVLPHVGPMQDLAKLVALYGMQKQAEGEWEEAAQAFLDVIRMGRHMGDQYTLAESIEGVRILEAGYYALGMWAVACPDQETIREVRLAIRALAPEELSPAMALGYESGLLMQSLSRLQDAFPDGNWAEMVLVTFDAAPPAHDPEAMREAAKEVAVQRGVPAAIFESETAFVGHIEMLRGVNRHYYEEMLDCLSLPTQQAIKEGQHIFDEFSPKLKRLGDPGAYNPAGIVAFYATHEAEHHILDLVLALCSKKADGLFPANLDAVADLFGGQVPASPYDGSPPSYKPTADRKGFEITYPGVKLGETELPEVKFVYEP